MNVLGLMYKEEMTCTQLTVLKLKIPKQFNGNI